MLLIILSWFIIIGGISAFTFYIMHRYGNHDDKHRHHTHVQYGVVNDCITVAIT